MNIVRKLIKIGLIFTIVFVFIGCQDNSKESSKNKQNHNKNVYNYVTDDMFQVVRDGKIGMMNMEKKIVIDCEYDSMTSFNEKGFAIVQKGVTGKDEYDLPIGGKMGTIDRKGKVIIPLEYDELIDCNNGNFIVQKESQVFLINSKGEKISEKQYDVLNYNYWSDGLITVGNNPTYDEYGDVISSDCGLVDYNGKEILSCEYKEIYPISNHKKNYLVVKKDTKYGVYDSEGKVVIPLEYDNISDSGLDGILFVEKNGKAGAIDFDEKIVIPFEYEPFNTIFNEYGYEEQIGGIRSRGDLLIAQKGDKYILIDKNNNKISDKEFDRFEIDLNNRLNKKIIGIKELNSDGENEYVYFDEKGKELFNIKGYKANMLSASGYTVVKQMIDGEYCYVIINDKGEEQSKIISEDNLSFGMFDLNGNVLVTSEDEDGGIVSEAIMNSKGKYIVEPIHNPGYPGGITYFRDELDIEKPLESYGFSITTKDGSIGKTMIYNLNGDIMKEYQGELITDRGVFNNGEIKIDNKFGHYEEIYDEEYDDYQDEYIEDSNGDTVGLLDKDWKMIIEPKYNEIYAYDDYYVCNKKDGGTLIDTKTRKVKLELPAGYTFF